MINTSRSLMYMIFLMYAIAMSDNFPKYIIDNKAKYAFEKFRKILENHMMKGMAVYDFPWWWKNN